MTQENNFQLLWKLEHNVEFGGTDERKIDLHVTTPDTAESMTELKMPPQYVSELDENPWPATR